MTVYFTSNPASRNVITNPAAVGADETKWNRGALERVYTKGWVELRPPDPGGHGPACGDTAAYSVEMDSMVSVYALPPGAAMTFYYLVSARNEQLCPGESAESLLGRDSSGTPTPNPFPCQ